MNKLSIIIILLYIFVSVGLLWTGTGILHFVGRIMTTILLVIQLVILVFTLTKETNNNIGD